MVYLVLRHAVEWSPRHLVVRPMFEDCPTYDKFVGGAKITEQFTILVDGSYFLRN